MEISFTSDKKLIMNKDGTRIMTEKNIVFSVDLCKGNLRGVFFFFP